MRNVLIFAAMLAASVLTAGTEPCTTINDNAFKQSESKDGKVTKKECLWVIVCTDHVEFRVSNTSIQTFIRISGDVWVDYGSNKVVSRVEQADGIVVFWKNERTAFAYPTK